MAARIDAENDYSKKTKLSHLHTFRNKDNEFTPFMAVVKTAYFLDTQSGKGSVSPKSFITALLDYLTYAGIKEVKRVNETEEMFHPLVIEYLIPKVFSGNNLDSGILMTYFEPQVVDCVMNALIKNFCDNIHEYSLNVQKRFFNHFKPYGTPNNNLSVWFSSLEFHVHKYGSTKLQKVLMELSLK